MFDLAQSLYMGKMRYVIVGVSMRWQMGSAVY
jgi:hypothetical protein